MKTDYFIDTNVFLDAILKRDNGEAKKYLDFFLKDRNSNAILNEISLINIHYIASNEFKDFEDNLQYLCAKYNFCKKIITSNKKDFKNSDIEVLTPKEFLTII